MVENHEIVAGVDPKKVPEFDIRREMNEKPRVHTFAEIDVYRSVLHVHRGFHGSSDTCMNMRSPFSS